MAATAQSQAIQIVNSIIALGVQLEGLYNQIGIVAAQWNNNGVQTVIGAFGTVSQNADGSQGASDGAPNNAHPMNLATYPALSRSISANQVSALLSILQDVQSFINGNALSATGGIGQIINGVVGG